MQGVMKGVEGIVTRLFSNTRRAIAAAATAATIACSAGCGGEPTPPPIPDAQVADGVTEEVVDSAPLGQDVLSSVVMSFSDDAEHDVIGGFREERTLEDGILFRKIGNASAKTIPQKVDIAYSFNTIASTVGCARAGFQSVLEEDGSVFVKATCGGVRDYTKIDRHHPVVQRNIVLGRYKSGFLDAVEAWCATKDAHCHSVLSTMDWFTHGTFRPDFQNRASTCGGLINTCEGSAKRLGTTVGKLLRMDQLEQLSYAFRYFEEIVPQDLDLSNPDNIALAIANPELIGDLDRIVATKRGKAKMRSAYRRLKRYDVNKNGRVTAREMVEVILDRGYLSPENRDLCFPVAIGSVRSEEDRAGYAYGLTYNFADKREGGRRKHRGFDIYTFRKGRILSIDDGIVISTSRKGVGTGTGRFYVCDGGQTGTGGDVGFVQIYHPHIHMTVLYGEIDTEDADLFRVGQKIQNGAYLGSARRCGMLHLEVERGRTTKLQYRSWLFGERQPADLINPDKLLDSMLKRGRFCDY